MIVNDLKRCPQCDTWKTLDCFHICKSKPDGVASLCKVCRSANKKKARAENPDKFREQSHKYHIEHKDDVSKRDKIKYLNGGNLYHKKYAETNKERILDYQREYQRVYQKSTNGKAINARYKSKRRDWYHNLEHTLDKEDILFLFELQDKKCCACGVSFEDVGYQIDHIIPISKGGPLVLNNVQLLCKKCNITKKAKTIDYLSYWLVYGDYKMKGLQINEYEWFY